MNRPVVEQSKDESSCRQTVQRRIVLSANSPKTNRPVVEQSNDESVIGDRLRNQMFRLEQSIGDRIQTHDQIYSLVHTVISYGYGYEYFTVTRVLPMLTLWPACL